MKIHTPFKCSLCGWEDPRKKPYQYNDINEHFLNAKEIWCPRNVCKTTHERIVPPGHVCNCWYDYSGWCTLEEKPKLIDFETAKSVARAKEIKRIALAVLEETQENERRKQEEERKLVFFPDVTRKED